MFLDIASIVMSAGIIGFSIYEASKRHELKAETYLRSSRLIYSLLSESEEILGQKNAEIDNVRRLQKEFDYILTVYEDTHDHVDMLQSYADSQRFDWDRYCKIRMLIEGLGRDSIDHSKLKTERWNLRGNFFYLVWKKGYASFRTVVNTYGIFCISIGMPALVFALFAILDGFKNYETVITLGVLELAWR